MGGGALSSTAGSKFPNHSRFPQAFWGEKVTCLVKTSKGKASLVPVFLTSLKPYSVPGFCVDATQICSEWVGGLMDEWIRE